MKSPFEKKLSNHWCLGLLLAGCFGASTHADTTDLQVVADTFINSGLAANNAGSSPWVDAGRDGPAGGGGVRRALLRFDLESLPAGSTVTSAVLQLRLVRVPGQGPVDSTFSVYRLNQAWGEGNKGGFNGAAATAGESTWTARILGTADWTQEGAAADAEGSASATTEVGSTAEVTYSWSGSKLTEDVQGWVNNPSSNFGWLLRSDDESSLRSVRGFAALGGGSTPARLVIGYTPALVTNPPPSVAITNPSDGASFAAPAQITIEAAATGSVASVEFFVGAGLLGTDTTSPYSFTASFFPGVHALSAIAVDTFGARATSAVVTITVTNQTISNPLAERIPKGPITVELQTIADGMASPVGMAVPDDGSGRIFVTDQDGRIWVVTGTGRLSEPLLDVSARLVLLGAYDERGLLGLAAHPGFAQNPFIYTYTSETNGAAADFATGLTNNNHQSVITEWRISTGNSNRVDLASRREVLRIDQPQSNHNGGAMHFGPDGLLYITLGDGGSANDVAAGHVPGGNAQSLEVIHGKIIRIDVHGINGVNGQYGVPASNPFVGKEGLDEIYAFGLRNPFSFSFDRQSGQLWLADVGQNRVEEINIIEAGGNYGWNQREGAFWFDSATGNIVTAPTRPPAPNMIDPIAMYDHDDGFAVIGGYVYRGSAIPELAGRYVFGDWGSFGAPTGRLFYLDETNGVKELRIGLEDRELRLWLKGIGEGPDGELYVFATKWLGPAGNAGRMLKIVPAPPAPALSGFSRAGTNVTGNITGGKGPFLVQNKRTLSDPAWSTAALLSGRSFTLPQHSQNALYRVRDALAEPAVPFSAHLAPVAGVNSTGTGLGLFALDGNSLQFNIVYNGLSGVPGMAHIHGPASSTGNAGILIDLGPFNGGTWNTNGTFSGVIVLTDTQKGHLMAGKTYVNIHTSAPGGGGGEIRGQIAPVNMQAVLGRDGSSARGLGNLTLVGNQLTMNVSYGGLSGTPFAAHIHGPAQLWESAGVLVDLDPFKGPGFGTQGLFSGTVALTQTQLGMVIDGLTYINIHTPDFGGGEIRGQILPQPAGVPLTTLMSGLAERPTPLTNSATGDGTFSLEGKTLAFNVHYRGLSGNALNAHIHGPTNSAGSTGVMIDLRPFHSGPFSTVGTFSGSITLTPDQRNAMLSGLTYVNVHTPSHPAGELRGQIAPVLMTTTMSGRNERPAVPAPGTGSGTFALVRDQLTMAAVYQDLLSPATMAHIHGPATATASAGVLENLLSLNAGNYGISGSFRGQLTLPYSTLLNVLDGRTYINIHTTNNPGGEIRGQLVR